MKFRDIGLSVGANFGFHIKGFIVSLEPLYTRYIIRGGKSVSYNGEKIKATPNTATIKLSLGYRF